MITKAVLCLASVIYAEARGEPIDGQLAVAQVVLNRAEDPRWPDTICDVTQQPRQFANLNPDPGAIALAQSVLSGNSFEHEATHFYSGPPPYWASHLDFIGTISGHTFMKE